MAPDEEIQLRARQWFDWDAPAFNDFPRFRDYISEVLLNDGESRALMEYYRIQGEYQQWFGEHDGQV